MFTDCTFRSNRATTGVAGSVWIGASSEPSFARCEFTDNEAGTSAGVAFIQGNAIT